MSLASPFLYKGMILAILKSLITLPVERERLKTCESAMIMSSSSFEGYPLQARHKQDWGRGFILLLPQTAALPGSDAGSDVYKPASSFVLVENLNTF